MIRGCVVAVAAWVGLLVAMPLANAAEVTLKMRGGTFEVTGTLRSFDLRKWVITAPGLGVLTLDAARYECISQGCPSRPVTADVMPVLPARPLTTTWIGGSAIGTEFMPRLIRAFAASLGAKATSQIGTDPKNLSFALTAPDGRLIGTINVNRQGVPQGFAAMAKGTADGITTAPPTNASKNPSE